MRERDRRGHDRPLRGVHLAHEGPVDLDLARSGSARAERSRSGRCRSRRRRARRRRGRACASTSSATMLSSTAAVSVISSVSAAGGMWWRRSASITRAGRSDSPRFARREVDRDADGMARRTPAGGLRERPIEHVVGQRRHQLAALDRGQEPIGRDEGAVAVPAQQRLGADDGAGSRVDERLVVQVELLVLQRLADLLDDLALAGAAQGVAHAGGQRRGRCDGRRRASRRRPGRWRRREPRPTRWL